MKESFLELLEDGRLSETQRVEHHERSSELPAAELANRRAPHRAGYAAGAKGRSARAHPARGGVCVRAPLLLAPLNDAAATPLDPPSPPPAGAGRRPVSWARLPSTHEPGP